MLPHWVSKPQPPAFVSSLKVSVTLGLSQPLERHWTKRIALCFWDSDFTIRTFGYLRPSERANRQKSLGPRRAYRLTTFELFKLVLQLRSVNQVP